MAKKKSKLKVSNLSAIRKKYAGSANAIDVLVDPDEMLWIPSRVLAVNHQWGGGAPYGKIIEIYGEESSGKSLLSTDFAYTTMALGGQVLWADAEFSFTKAWATMNGLELDNIEIYQEKGIELISDWSVEMALYYRSQLTNNEPILLVVDSLAATDCMENLEASQVDAKAEMGNRAKAIDKWLRTRQKTYEELGVTVILINQLRAKIGATPYEDPDCLHYNTTIPLTDGTFKTIGEIVENKLDVKVWSLDIENNQYVEKSISDWVAKEDWDYNEDKWYNLQTTGPSTNNGVNGITCTGGHLLLNNNREWLRADKLKTGDKLLSKTYLPNQASQDILEVMSIGDMGISIRKENSACITLRDNENPEYLNYKLSLLSSICKFEKSIDNRGYDYYRSDYHYFLTIIKRQVNRDPLNCRNLFTSTGMALWYMDDGHISKKGQVSISISPNRTDLQELALKLSKHGFECKPYKKGIRFTKKGSDKLFRHIGKNIHHSMYYKIPKEYLVESSTTLITAPLFSLELQPIEVTVTKIQEAGKRNYKGTKGRVKYDLSIEGTKNFLAGNTTNGFVVHNTTPGGRATRFYASIRCGIYAGKALKLKFDKKEHKVGKYTSIRIKKNKVSPPRDTLSKIEVYFKENPKFPIGFNRYFGLDEILLDKEVIEKKGSRYYLGDKMIANGRDALMANIYDDADLRKQLIKASGINTVSKTKRLLSKITENRYPVAAGSEEDE